jgi:2,3,4,5-tetrahydropyridine-2-carboxylate N-succinyltransferase
MITPSWKPSSKPRSTRATRSRTSTRGETRDAVEEALNLLDSGKAARRGTRRRRNLARQPVAEESGAAVVPPQPDGNDFRAVRARRVLVGQGAAKFGGWSGQRFRGAGFRAVPNCVVRKSAYIAQGRGADAVLRQSRRLCRRAAPWSTPGPPSAPARRSARTCTCRAASASAACWNRCRPARPSSRTTASSARAPKSSRAASCAKGSVLGMGVFIGKSTKIVNRATGEVILWRGARGLRRRRRLDAVSQERRQPLLRRDREDRRREDPFEDRHQRIAARLTSMPGSARTART